MRVETGSPATFQRKCDVLIIGGGPAGSTAAITLAEMGYDVALLKKAHHPRFHCLKEPSRAAAALKHFDAVSRHGPKEFSWFIHRVTNPTMRDLFMGPPIQPVEPDRMIAG
jgi:flavin-dependent dehydrogenase